MFLRKKCLNVIRSFACGPQRWTGPVAAASNQARRRKEMRAVGVRRGRGEGTGVNFSGKNPHWWIVYRVPVPIPTIPSPKIPRPSRSLAPLGHTYIRTRIWTYRVLSSSTVEGMPPPRTAGQRSLPKYRGIMLNGGRSKGPTESGGELS